MVSLLCASPVASHNPVVTLLVSCDILAIYACVPGDLCGISIYYWCRLGGHLRNLLVGTTMPQKGWGLVLLF